MASSGQMHWPVPLQLQYQVFWRPRRLNPCPRITFLHPCSVTHLARARHYHPNGEPITSTTSVKYPRRRYPLCTKMAFSIARWTLGLLQKVGRLKKMTIMCLWPMSTRPRRTKLPFPTIHAPLPAGQLRTMSVHENVVTTSRIIHPSNRHLRS